LLQSDENIKNQAKVIAELMSAVENLNKEKIEI